MPITGPNSYPQTAAEFQSHWATVNNTLGSAVALPDGTRLADFTARVAVMDAAFESIAPAVAGERAAAADLDLKRDALMPRMVQFGQAVRLYLSKTRFKDAAPRVPAASAGEQKFKEATQAIAARWADIDAAKDLAPFKPPLQLPPDAGAPGKASPYSAGDFDGDASALADAFTASRLAEEAATQKRRDRDALLPAVYEAMKTYREACLLLLPAGSPLLATLPRLSPAPGTTPTALAVSGEWDAGEGKAVLRWPATEVRDASKLQVRGCIGAYKAADEQVIADLDQAALTWSGDWGLQAAGSTASFKVYVMTSTGNENGGKAVKITRPDA